MLTGLGKMDPRSTWRGNTRFCRYVSAEPAWAKQLEGEMMLGKHTLTFLASSPVTNQTASCQMQIHIKELRNSKWLQIGEPKMGNDPRLGLFMIL